jgi:hypothetical protein
MLYTDIWYTKYIFIIIGFLKSCQPQNTKMIKIFAFPKGVGENPEQQPMEMGGGGK